MQVPSAHPSCRRVTIANLPVFPGCEEAWDYFRATNDVECLKFFTLLSCESFIKHDGDPEEILDALKLKHNIEVYDNDIANTAEDTGDVCPWCRGAETMRMRAKMIYKSSARNMILKRLLHLERLNEQKCLHELVVKLVDYTPHIESFEDFEVTLKKAKDCSKDGIQDDTIEDAAKLFLNILDSLELWFHPLIRKGHRHTLLAVFKQLYRSECLKFVEGFESKVVGYFREKKSDVYNLIETKKESSKLYQEAKYQVSLHQAFVAHIFRCAFESDILKRECSVEEVLEDETVVPERFGSLDRTLIELSLGEMLDLLKDVHLIECYLDCINKFMKEDSELLRNRVDDLICLLKNVGFPDCPTKDEKHFHLLLKAIQENYFCNLPEDYVVLGVMHYHEMRELMPDPAQLQDFTFGIQTFFSCKVDFLKEAWKKGSRFYDHEIYRTYYEPLRVLVWN